MQTMTSFSAVGSKCRPIPPSFQVLISNMELMAASLAINTCESYAKGLKSFEEFRQLYSLTRAWPPAIQQLIKFVSYLSLKGSSPATVKSNLAGIGYKCKITLKVNVTQNFVMKKMISGMEKH